MEIAQPAQGVCDGRESDCRGVGVDEPAVAGDEETGRAECDEWGAIDAESVEEQCDVVATAIGSSGPYGADRNKGKIGMGCRLFGQERLPNQAEKVDTEQDLGRRFKWTRRLRSCTCSFTKLLAQCRIVSNRFPERPTERIKTTESLPA